MNFDTLNKDQCEIVRKWRNADISFLRTPFLLTKEMQENFYEKIICDRNSEHKYWAIIDKKFIGMAGLTNISHYNKNAEISIIIDPKKKSKKKGEEALLLLLNLGFNELNLENIYGECYFCNPAIKFWKRIIEKYILNYTWLPFRKYYNGEYWNSIYFNFRKEVFNDNNRYGFRKHL